MNVKEAVRAANKYITELFADEEVQDLGLEEVVFDETANAWKITIGFSRPWERRSLAANLGGQDWKNRSFKVVEINDHTGEIVAMTHRSVTTDFAVFDRIAEAFKDVDDLSAKIDQAVDESKATHNRPATS